jgi:hypothetical protein
MATQDKKDTSQDRPHNTLSSKQTIGAIVGIAVLLGLLFFGTQQNEPAGASMITDQAKPEESMYQQSAMELNYEDALLKEYDHGALIELKGKVNSILEEPVKGEGNVLLDLAQDQSAGAENVKSQQVMLVYPEQQADLPERQSVHLFGRYIGTVEFETSVGSMQKVPAIQVDYLSETS